MTIYERIKPHDINKYEYERFLSNDKELEWCRSIEIHFSRKLLKGFSNNKEGEFSK